ncbi:MAG: glycerate kinase [Dethiobacteria bacterium]
MRLIIAPDKFKNSMTASEAAERIAAGVNSVLPEAELKLLPLSDGGEGLTEALCGAGKGIIFTTEVTDPLGSNIKANWGITDRGDTAVIEMAAASGLALISSRERDPKKTTTYGTGELIRAALDHGCKKLIIGIGGSATNDGGAGMAEALGVKFLDRNGNEIGRGGVELQNLSHIDLSGLDPRLKTADIKVACDVDNPLTGLQGASYIYGPQKGADSGTVTALDRALSQLAAIIKKDLDLDIEQTPGAGAAGGLGAGLMAFLGATLYPGIELVLDALKIENFLPGCNLLITGEGSLDSQSLHGKAPVGIAKRAASHSVPVIALAGRISGDPTKFHQVGINACFAIADGPLTLAESLKRGPELIEHKVRELMLFWSTGMMIT